MTLKLNSPTLIIFDCDGTLVDSQASIVTSICDSFAGIGLDPPAPEQIREQIGLPLTVAYENLRPELSASDLRRLVLGYGESVRAMRAQGTVVEPLFPGIVECLEALAEAGHLLGIATGKGMPGLRHTLAAHGMETRFDTLQTPDNLPGKPCPEMLYAALEETGVAAENAIMIGDTTFDMEMARNAGVTGLGVSWGYHQREDLIAHGTERIIDDVADLAPAVQNLMERKQCVS